MQTEENKNIEVKFGAISKEETEIVASDKIQSYLVNKQQISIQYMMEGMSDAIYAADVTSLGTWQNNSGRQKRIYIEKITIRGRNAKQLN